MSAGSADGWRRAVSVFRFELVVRINTMTAERCDRERLVSMAMAARLALSTLQFELKDPDPRLPGDIAIARTRVQDLVTFAGTRTAVEQRYLVGHQALFPDLAQEWDAVVAEVIELDRIAHELGARVPGTTGPRRRTSHRRWQPPPRSHQAEMANLVEAAQTTTLEKLDDQVRAMGIAILWVRGSLGTRRT